MSPSGILSGNFIQAAYAFYDRCHPIKKDRDEGGHRTKHEGRCRRLRHHMRKLSRFHVSAPPSRKAALAVDEARASVEIVASSWIDMLAGLSR
jgi:hypothetical protein